jgi:hypothetical protein
VLLMKKLIDFYINTNFSTPSLAQASLAWATFISFFDISCFLVLIVDILFLVQAMTLAPVW